MATPAPTANIMRASCTSRRVLDLIADQWTALVFYALECGPRRFNQMRREIEGISQKMLTQTLRELERNGLVERTIYPVVPPRVEYRLTPLGETLIGPMNVLRHWAEGHLPEVAAAQAAYDRSR